MTLRVKVLDQPADSYEAITVSNVAIGFTAGNITGKKGVYLSVEADEVRYRYDGTDPTATEGHLLYVGDRLQLMHPTVLSKFRMIRVTTDATVRCTYF